MRKPNYLFIIFLLLISLYAQSVGSFELQEEAFQERTAHWQERLGNLEYVGDEVIVEFNDTRSLNSIDAGTFEGYEISEVFDYRPVVVYRKSSTEPMAEALARLEGLPGVKSVSPNLIRYCTITPDDPFYDRQEYLTPIHAEAAWDVTTGSSTVNVAVIDTGVDIEHPEFAGRILWTENFFDPDAQGESNVFDDSGHGTGVAGIILAEGYNGMGVAGISWDVRLLAYRACGSIDLHCTIADEVQAIDSAVAHGAHVINLSLGGKGTVGIEVDAIEDAYNAGVVIVAASGNGTPGELFVSSGDPDWDRINLYYPAAFPQVMGVAALDNSDGSVTDPGGLFRAEFSNYGEDIVSVATVGTRIMSTVPYRPKGEVPYAIYFTRDYSRLSGTSFACPQVTGVAALLFSRFPTASPLDIRNIIETTAWPMGGPDTNTNGVDDYLGHGLLDAGAALGNIIGGDGIFENSDFRLGVTPSPLFSDDIFVLVHCKRGSDDVPVVSFYVHANGDNGAITMEPLAAHPDTYMGRFRTVQAGQISFQVHGLLQGSPLTPLMVDYMLID